MMCRAKSTFSIPMENGTETNFIIDKEYRCVERSNGDMVVMDENKQAVQLRRVDFDHCFAIE